MSAPTPESLQTLILTTLASSSSGSIDDSRDLQTGEGSKLGPVETQLVLKGVLDSLLSREVCPIASQTQGEDADADSADDRI